MTRVLIVEDDDDDFFLVTRELRKCGITEVNRAEDGRAAIDYLSGRDAYADRTKFPLPDVVLLDLKLPKVMGHDVLKAIRQNPALLGLRVYVLTGSDEHRDREQVEKIGCEGYFVKPLTAAQAEELFKK